MKAEPMLSAAVNWLRSATSRVAPAPTTRLSTPRHQTLCPPPEPPVLALVTPHGHFLAGEALQIQMLPADRGGRFELDIRGAKRETCSRQIVANHQLLLPRGLPEDAYTIRARWTDSETDSPEGDEVHWSEWSRPLAVWFHPSEHAEQVWPLRIREHRLSLMCSCDRNGVRTLTDPWAMPPNAPENEPLRWFRTAAYEGSTVLLNEEPDYYRDPLAYYLACLDELLVRNARFLTWHDLLEGRAGTAELEIVLQFDMDAGPRSMARLVPHLCERGIQASIMVHRESRQWYQYRLDDMDLGFLKDAQAAGWTIGYHNNTLTTLQARGRQGDYGPEIMAEAQRLFAADVAFLQQHFDLRVFNHHGGNVFNNRLTPPSGINLQCVDKPFNPQLWSAIRSSFSDGGFFARPQSLREKIRNLTPGMHFFRNHPAKYANYTPPFDIPPLTEADAIAAGAELTEQLRRQMRESLNHQATWLGQRDEIRLSTRLDYASVHKPVSARFSDFTQVVQRVERLRRNRRAAFLQQYPWIQGDPRVFWWRMLEAYLPSNAKVLNVGALPPEQVQENEAFLPPGTSILQMDIDPSRRPDIIGDITNPDPRAFESFDAALLFGLPYINAPSLAVDACAKLTRPGGLGLFGMVADTHPFRGGRWHPENRPVWRKDRQPLADIGLRGNLWSFDDRHLHDLFAPWSLVEIEFFAHYWFVVCRKETA